MTETMDKYYKNNRKTLHILDTHKLYVYSFMSRKEFGTLAPPRERQPFWHKPDPGSLLSY